MGMSCGLIHTRFHGKPGYWVARRFREVKLNSSSTPYGRPDYHSVKGTPSVCYKCKLFSSTISANCTLHHMYHVASGKVWFILSNGSQKQIRTARYPPFMSNFGFNCTPLCTQQCTICAICIQHHSWFMLSKAFALNWSLPPFTR